MQRYNIKEIFDFKLPTIVSSDFKNQEKIGAILDVGADNYLIRDDNKNYLKLLQNTLDHLNVNKNIELILRNIETQYKAIYENNIAMFFTLDMDNRIISVNSFASENLGYGKLDLEDNLFSDLTHDEDSEDVIKQLELCKLNPGQVFNWEFRLRRQDGSYIWVKDNAFTIEDKHTKTLFISCDDITIRKQAEESSAEWKNRYETAVEATSQILYDYNIETGEVALGGDLFGTLGYTNTKHPSNLDEFVELIHPDDTKIFLNSIPKIKESKHPFYIQFRLKRSDGEYLFVESNMRYIGGADSKQDRIIGFIEDVTIKKRVEGEIIKSQKLESLGRLAGGIANDFNNLLTGIIGNISLIKTKLPTQDDKYDKLMEIESASIRAKDLTQKLFIFSTGGSPEKVMLDPMEIVKEATEFAPKESKLNIEIQQDENIHRVFADRDQILQVINNVILNAGQAMPQGGKLSLLISNITINGEDLSLPLTRGEYVEISAIEEGSGITEENLSKIFDPYFTTKESGSGLGLSTAHSIISKHNGYIDVISETGEGTRVDIYLPAYFGIPDDQVQKVSDHFDKNLINGKRILVMDDEDLIRKVAGNILEHLNCTVEFAVEGKEAAEIYEREFVKGNPFDFVILDLTVRNGMGGLECLEKLREIDPGVKAIVSSGYSNDPALLRYKDYGFIGVINKPYEIEDFISSFNIILNN